MNILEAPVQRSSLTSQAYWYLNNRFVVLADAGETDNEYGLVHGLIDPAGTPSAHVHDREDEVFYVVRGEGRILVGDQEFVGKPGDLFYLPRGVAHVPMADSEEVETLILISPANFLGYFQEFMQPATHAGHPSRQEIDVPAVEDMLRAGHRYGVTFLPPAATVGSWPVPEIHAEPRHVKSDAGDQLGILASRVTVKLDGAATQGLFSIFEIEDLPGAGMPPNIHRNDSEAFYVLDGHYEVMVEWMTDRVGPGSFVYIPRGVARSYRNVGSTIGKMLQISAKSGHEDFYREVHANRGCGEGRFNEIAHRHGIDIVG